MAEVCSITHGKETEGSSPVKSHPIQPARLPQGQEHNQQLLENRSDRPALAQHPNAIPELIWESDMPGVRQTEHGSSSPWWRCAWVYLVAFSSAASVVRTNWWMVP